MESPTERAPGAADEMLFCPVARTMCLLEQKWTLQIVKELVQGKRRFCQLQHALHGDARDGDVRDVNPKTLSQRLKTLEACGIVTRRMISDIPPNVEYELTLRGHDLASIIASIEAWARKWMDPRLTSQAVDAAVADPVPLAAARDTFCDEAHVLTREDVAPR